MRAEPLRNARETGGSLLYIRYAELSTATAMQMIASATMTPIRKTKRSRALSQRERFVSPAVCICADGNTLPPLDISGRGKIASKSLPMTCNMHGNHGAESRGVSGAIG